MIAQFLCWFFASGVWVDPITGKYTCNGDFNWWMFGLFIFLFYTVGHILVDIYFGPVPDNDEIVSGWSPDPWKTQLDPDRVTLTKMDDGRTMMDYQGQHKTFHFIWWRDKRTDMPVVQRTNEKGQHYDSPVLGSRNAWRFGSTPDDSLFDHIRYTINTEDN